MKVSEAISILTSLLQEHGDLDLVHHDDWTEWHVESIEYQPGEQKTSSYPELQPYVLILGEKAEYDIRYRRGE